MKVNERKRKHHVLVCTVLLSLIVILITFDCGLKIISTLYIVKLNV